MRQSKRLRSQEYREAPQPQTYVSKLHLSSIDSKTVNQSKVFRDFRTGKHIMLSGCAGTGKTFLSIFLALEAIERGLYDKLVIYRCAVPTQREGFLPGTAEQKAAVYEAPYIGICAQLYNNKDAYSKLKEQGKIEFATTSFIRGITINNSIVYLDEIQNSSFDVISSVATRIGTNCRLILSGDYRQTDLDNKNKSGINKALSRMNQMPEVSSVEFTTKDIVRSDFARHWIELDYSESAPHTCNDLPAFLTEKKLQFV